MPAEPWASSRWVAGGAGDEPPFGVDDADAVNRTADEILSRRAFQPPQESPLDAVLGWIGDRLGSLLENAAGFDGGRLLGLVFVAAVVGGVAVAAVKLFRTPTPVAAGAVEVGVAYGTDAPTDPEVWVAEARRLADAGDHRGALRCWYQAVVADLIARRLVDPVPGTTARELRDRAEGVLGAQPELRWLVDRFEVAWFGGGSSSAEEVLEAQRARATLRRAHSRERIS